MSEENYTLEPITAKEALKELYENDGKPVSGFAFKTQKDWKQCKLTGVQNNVWQFGSMNGWHTECARIIYGYGYLPNGTKVTDKYPLPEEYELCPLDKPIGDHALYINWERGMSTYLRSDWSSDVTPRRAHRLAGVDFDKVVYLCRVSPVAARHNPDGVTEANGDTFLAESVEAYYRKKHRKEFGEELSGYIHETSDGKSWVLHDFKALARAFPELRKEGE